MLPVLMSPRGRIFADVGCPEGPCSKSLSSSGCTVLVGGMARTGVPLGMPAGMEKPTIEDVGRRDFDDDAAVSDD